MKTLHVDENNDFVVAADGQLGMLSGIPAIGQTSVQFGKARRDEMIHKMDEGMPYALVAWAQDPNEAAFEAAMRDRLSQVTDVTAVTAFEIVRDGERLGYTATLATALGDTVING